MNPIGKVSLPEIQKGDYRIEHFVTDRIDFRSQFSGRGIPVGQKYSKLMRGNTLVMSDTPSEINDILQPYYKAKGSCLINGLGIGVLLNALIKKEDVDDITIVEISQDVIDMVSPFYSSPKCTFIQHDALTYLPPKNKRFNMVWHDIWDYICADNLTEMKKLHRKYGKRTDWQGSWCRERCELGR